MTTVAARASGEKRAKVEERGEKKAFLDRKRPEKGRDSRKGDLLARARSLPLKALEKGALGRKERERLI